METRLIQHNKLVGTAIERQNERVAILILSLNVPVLNSAHLAATKYVFTEILTAGAGTLSREKFLDALSSLGAHITVSVHENTISISVSSLNTSLKKTLPLLEQMLLKPTFSNVELIRIKEYLCNQLVLSKEDAKGQAYRGFISALTQNTDPRHMFSNDELITQIRKITVSDLKKLHKMALSSEWKLSCAGSKESCLLSERFILKISASAPQSSTVSSMYTPAVLLENRIVSLKDIPHKQNIEFSIGNTLPIRYLDPEFAAFVFGLHVLALYGGFTGRLMSTVREKEGLTYGIYGQTENVTKSENGFWRIATFFNEKDAKRGLQSTLREINHMQENGITEDELKRFKAILNTRTELIEDSIVKKTKVLHARMEMGLTEAEYASFKSEIQQMTCAKVNAAMKKYLNASQLVISGAGPVQKVKKELEAFTHTN